MYCFLETAYGGEGLVLGPCEGGIGRRVPCGRVRIRRVWSAVGMKLGLWCRLLCIWGRG